MHDFYIHESDDHVTEEGVKNGTRLVPCDTVLILVRGMSLHSELRVGITKRTVTFNQDIKALVAVDDVVPLFLAYALKGYRSEILGLVDAAGHGTGRLQTGPLSDLTLPLPPLPKQRRIAAVLGALDDRIEVNRRMNRTLEQMAQALFRSRFVDFDGRDDLARSEAGVIPAGWRWGTPTDLITFDPQVKLKKGTTARYLGMSEVPTEGFGIGNLEERPYAGGSKFILGDTLLARITPCLENGKTTLVDFLQPGEVAFGSTEFIVMRGREYTPPEFVYCLARLPEFRSFAIQHMTRSSGRQRVAAESFNHYVLPVPPSDELDVFGRMARPVFERIWINHRHNRTLTTLRDALLPKLISGEIRVPEAEEAIADALPAEVAL